MEPVTRQEVIGMLTNEIEKCKRSIVLLDNNKLIPFKLKHEKIHNLRVTMQQMQRALLVLLQEEYNETRRAG